MARPGAIVLIDANGMIEAHKKGCWAARSARYRLETVEKCFEETQTGFQLRRPEERIDPVALRASLAAVHPVTLRQLAAIDVLDGPILDDGEKALWAHALQREDAWILCGPDRASMTFGHIQKRRERLVSLGSLLDAIGHRASPALASQYEKAWLDKLLLDLLLGIK